MRKLMIVAGALAAVTSLGAMRTANAAEVNPGRAPTAQPAATHSSNSVDDAWGHRVYPAPTRPTPTDRDARHDSDASGSRGTSHSVPSRVSDPRAGQRNSSSDDGRANNHQKAPSRVAGHDVKTPVRQPSHSSHDTHARKWRVSARRPGLAWGAGCGVSGCGVVGRGAQDFRVLSHATLVSPAAAARYRRRPLESRRPPAPRPEFAHDRRERGRGDAACPTLQSTRQGKATGMHGRHSERAHENTKRCHRRKSLTVRRLDAEWRQERM